MHSFVVYFQKRNGNTVTMTVFAENQELAIEQLHEKQRDLGKLISIKQVS